MSPRESDVPGEITALLVAWRRGDRTSFDRLFPLVYDELRILARRQLKRAAGGPALNTTALIHEVYLKLVDQTRAEVHDRHHFFALAAKAMRHILVNHAQSSLTEKRGAGRANLSLDEAEPVVHQEAAEVVALHEALDALNQIDPRKSRVVEMRYFGGLSIEETAEVLGISTITVNRDWRMARTWLIREMNRKSS